ncbi:MAG: hypothetical protein M1827_004952 [Pycnora praestabilis]|nr:MAG: hypothetical protein M1827_004952 [Pycnora praestabilis]
MADHCSACLTLPAVITSDYKPKGRYEKLAGLDVYITGNESSKRGIITVYDVFGPQPPTLQGADRLSSHLDALVLVPDFFKGKAIELSIFPIDSDEKKQRAQKFMAEQANPEVNVGVLKEVTIEAKEKWRGVEGWGSLGLCWGGKLVALASGPGTPFKASGQAHPGRLAKEDAQAIRIPHICLFSPEDGTPEAMEEYGDVLKQGKSNVVEMYSSMFHGWMGARAKLENEDNAKEFERGYVQVADFFNKHL